MEFPMTCLIDHLTDIMGHLGLVGVAAAEVDAADARFWTSPIRKFDMSG